MRHADIVEAIYSASANSDLWPATLIAVADYVGATAGNLVYQAPDAKNSFLIPARMREDLNDLYLRYYARNPYARAFEKVHPDTVAIGNQLIDAEAVRKTAYYADICSPQNIYNQLFLPHVALHEPGGIGGIALFLSRTQNQHVDRATKRLTELTPHLSRAIDMSLHIRKVSQEAGLLQRLVEAMSDAVVLLNGRAEIVVANSAAEDLLLRGDGLAASRTEGHVRLSLSADNPKHLVHEIRQAIETCNGTATAFKGTVYVTRPSGLPPYLVNITPLLPGSFAAWDATDGGARVLVQIVDIDARTAAQAEKLRILFGLTNAETKVASLLGGGLSIPEVAKTLTLSPNTVKTHANRVLAKVGVRSQSALARLMASVPISSIIASTF